MMVLCIERGIDMPGRFTLSEGHQGRFLDAAAYVNERFLGKPFGSTCMHARLFNQRFLVQLQTPSGSTIYGNGYCFFDERGKPYGDIVDNNGRLVLSPTDIYDITWDKGTSEAEKLSYEEISRIFSTEPEARTDRQLQIIAACANNQISVLPNVNGLASKGYSIVNVVHRQNHGIHHSMRAAASIPDILSIDGTDPTTVADEFIEKMQLMMLFSVVGRRDETGFADTGQSKEGNRTYQSFRATSGLEYLKYCSGSNEIYSESQKASSAHYRDALVVEFMGYQNIDLALDNIKVYTADTRGVEWLKEHVANDYEFLVETGAITEAEANAIKAPTEECPEDQAINNAVARLRREQIAIMPRKFIPGVLLRYVNDNFRKLGSDRLLSADQVILLREMNASEERLDYIKKIIPNLLRDGFRERAFPFLKEKQAMQRRLSLMNQAHGYDLSRCYPLEASYRCRVFSTDVDLDEEALKQLFAKNIIVIIKKEEGFGIIYKNEAGYFVGSPVKDLDTIARLRHATVCDTADVMRPRQSDIQLPYSSLLKEVIDSAGVLPQKAQMYGQIASGFHRCFNITDKERQELSRENNPDWQWDLFKQKAANYYDFCHAIEEKQLRTGDKLFYRLEDKNAFMDFLNTDVGIKEQFTRIKVEDRATPRLNYLLLDFLGSVVEKFAAPRSSNSQEYDFKTAFELFEGRTLDERDYQLEVEQCARSLDAVATPDTSIEPMCPPPLFESTEDRKDWALVEFSSEHELQRFCSLVGTDYGYTIPPEHLTSDNKGVYLPPDRYNSIKEAGGFLSPTVDKRMLVKFASEEALDEFYNSSGRQEPPTKDGLGVYLSLQIHEMAYELLQGMGDAVTEQCLSYSAKFSSKQECQQFIGLLKTKLQIPPESMDLSEDEKGVYLPRDLYDRIKEAGFFLSPTKQDIVENEIVVNFASEQEAEQFRRQILANYQHTILDKYMTRDKKGIIFHPEFYNTLRKDKFLRSTAEEQVALDIEADYAHAISTVKMLELELIIIAEFRVKLLDFIVTNDADAATSLIKSLSDEVDAIYHKISIMFTEAEKYLHGAETELKKVRPPSVAKMVIEKQSKDATTKALNSDAENSLNKIMTDSVMKKIQTKNNINERLRSKLSRIVSHLSHIQLNKGHASSETSHDTQSSTAPTPLSQRFCVPTKPGLDVQMDIAIYHYSKHLENEQLAPLTDGEKEYLEKLASKRNYVQTSGVKQIIEALNSNNISLAVRMDMAIHHYSKHLENQSMTPLTDGQKKYLGDLAKNADTPNKTNKVCQIIGGMIQCDYEKIKKYAHINTGLGIKTTGKKFFK